MVADNALGHTIGGRILALRDEKNVSQLELAKALGISTSALRNIEHGFASPRLATLELLADYFNVSIDYLVRGVKCDGGDSGHLDIYRMTGLTDVAIAFLQEQIDLGKNAGGLSEYITTLNALVSEGLLTLVWSLSGLNFQLAELDAEIKKVLAETPTPENIVQKMELGKTLEPLRERRDLLKLRYLRHVEKVFDSLIMKGEG